MPKRSDKERRSLRAVFRQTMAHYHELKSVQGSHSCAALYRAMQYDSRVNTAGKVMVNDIDLICDIELAARRSLTEEEHFFFKTIYLQGDEKFENELLMTVGEPRMNERRYDVQEKVGAELVSCGVFPIDNYRKPVDCRR